MERRLVARRVNYRSSRSVVPGLRILPSSIPATDSVSTYPQRLQRPWVLVWLAKELVIASPDWFLDLEVQHTACQSWKFPWLSQKSATIHPKKSCAKRRSKLKSLGRVF